jgi:hypothetical protein
MTRSISRVRHNQKTVDAKCIAGKTPLDVIEVRDVILSLRFVNGGRMRLLEANSSYRCFHIQVVRFFFANKAPASEWCLRGLSLPVM